MGVGGAGLQPQSGHSCHQKEEHRKGNPIMAQSPLWALPRDAQKGMREGPGVGCRRGVGYKIAGVWVQGEGSGFQIWGVGMGWECRVQGCRGVGL